MSRKLRKNIISMLENGDRKGLADLLDTNLPVKFVSPLVSAFYLPKLKWEAVLAFGKVVDELTIHEPESGRIVIRRLMWSLNDESGGIGWGAPEGMAEAMCRNGLLAREYSRILLSYIREDGNYLEYLPLRRGALWGLMRFSRFRPKIFNEMDGGKWLLSYLYDTDPESRALAALGLGYSGESSYVTKLESLLDDLSELKLFINEKLQSITPAKAALAAISLLK